MRFSFIFLAMLFAWGCRSNSPVEEKHAAVNGGEITKGNGGAEDQWVRIAATVENYGYYAKGAPHAESVTESGSSAAILRIDESSMPGPQRIIVFFPSDAPESLVVLFQTKGTVLEFKMKMSWFRAAAFQGAAVEGATTVFVGALEAVTPRRQAEKANSG